MGELAGGELHELLMADRINEPVLTHWDAWGNRIDHIDVTPLWKRAKVIAAERGLVATAYEKQHGRYSRILQQALVYLFAPSSDVYTCPLAMTDGAAQTLLKTGNQVLIDRALPRLTSRNPEQMWTSGQWMTESTGGSDVGKTETVAKQEGDTWRLYGPQVVYFRDDERDVANLGPAGRQPAGRPRPCHVLRGNPRCSRTAHKTSKLPVSRTSSGHAKCRPLNSSCAAPPPLPCVDSKTAFEILHPCSTLRVCGML